MASFCSLVCMYFCFLSITIARPNPGTYYPPTASCEEYSISITVNTPTIAWNASKWDDQYGLTDFVTLAVTRASAGFPPPFYGPVDFEGNFTISASFCTPKHPKGGHEKTVLLATHGIGFERSYWNSPYEPEEYNFVQYAINEGYSVFFYDRLGTGLSSIISGFVNTAQIQVNILDQLSNLIMSGSYTSHIGVPKALVLVGHSTGSFLSNALLAQSPHSADAAILTGLGIGAAPSLVTEAFNPRIASKQSPKFADLDNGYLTWVDEIANINCFFKYPHYTSGAASFTESHKQPFGILELTSLYTLNLNATAFTGPTMFLSGEFDFIECAGYCPGTLEVAAKTQVPNAKPLVAVSVDGMGHGINFHENATAAYGIMVNFLTENGF